MPPQPREPGRRRNLPQADVRAWPEALGRGKDPRRRCLATGAVKDKPALVRFVADPQGALFPDIRERLPGRGAWVSARRDAITSAVKRGLFAKALRTNVKAPDDLAGLVERLILRHALDLLGLARKAGLVAAGAAQALQALRAQKAVALIEACDASPRAGQRLRNMAEAQNKALVRCFSAAELGLALGRENVVHAALTAGPLAARFLGEAARLDGFRGADVRAGTLARPVLARRADSRE